MQVFSCYLYIFFNSQIILTLQSLFEIGMRKPSMLANPFEDKIVTCSGDLWTDRSLKKKKKREEKKTCSSNTLLRDI